ncbi:Ser/Thr phosphatase family protein [Trichuris suis]
MLRNSDDPSNFLGGLLAKSYAYMELDESELMELVESVLTILRKEASLLEVDAPILVCGDTHGQFFDLIRLFERGGWPPDKRYLFLGDYVDRGRQGIEVIVLMFLFKSLFPNDFYILRGNHECHAVNRVYGFYQECEERYSSAAYLKIQEAFAYLPIAGLVSGRIFCLHGGLSPNLTDMDQVRSIRRPLSIVHETFVSDLLWSDPNREKNGWGTSKRGIGHTFGPDVVHEFCRKLDIDLIIRAHQVVDYGFEFFAGDKLLTVFSAPNYCGVFSNAAGIVHVDKNLKCRILQLTPTHLNDTFNP